MFPANLREARKSKGLTQGELARMSGLALETISRWERGDRKPRIYDVEKVAEQLGVTAASLLGTEEQVPVPDDIAAPLEMLIAARLKAARRRLFTSEQELADVLNQPRRAVVNWETGRVTPNTDMLTRIAAVLDVSLAYLLGESDTVNTYSYESAPYAEVRDRARREARMMTPDQREETIFLLKRAIAELEDSSLPTELSKSSDDEYVKMDYNELVETIERARKEIEKLLSYPPIKHSAAVRAMMSGDINAQKDIIRRASMELDRRNKTRVLSDI